MKNKSPRYPFETPIDKNFDSNADGKLDSFESEWRDFALDEMHRNANEPSPHSASGWSDSAGCAIWIVVLFFFLVASYFSSCAG